MRLTQEEELEMISFLIRDLGHSEDVLLSFPSDIKELKPEHKFLRNVPATVVSSAVLRASFLKVLMSKNKLPPLTKEGYRLIDLWTKVGDGLPEEEVDDT
ncbi:hypothetical protein [Pleurocapsa sp. CCALA 161]|uniref:hypothetical protein n=1 Tax=Pleurocapsa sp. CCALA 161 TaxID=2107688 RepID=UPI0011B28DC5|nr:hypothetical protein [Pleurocapsa sp. CCALA 161]